MVGMCIFDDQWICRTGIPIDRNENEERENQTEDTDEETEEVYEDTDESDEEEEIDSDETTEEYLEGNDSED